MTYKDMTLCKGVDCKMKDSCVRHKYYTEGSEMGEYMAIFTESPINNIPDDNTYCDYYVGMEYYM